jgi:hypothetical protein
MYLEDLNDNILAHASPWKRFDIFLVTDFNKFTAGSLESGCYAVINDTEFKFIALYRTRCGCFENG